MYRVLLKVNKVGLRIKQNISVQLAIKKGAQNIILNQKSRLEKCIATFDTQMEFFVTPQDPTFGLCVMIVVGQGRKFAGIYNVDLRKYEENSNNSVQEKLEQSPDSQAYAVFEFVYMTTNFKSADKNLVSIEQLQYESQKEIAKEMQERNDFLISENNRLDIELQNLKKDNQNLCHNKNQMNNYYEQSLKSYEQEWEKRKEEAENSENDMKIMIDRMNRLKNLVEEHGNQNMRDRISQFLKNQ